MYFVILNNGIHDFPLVDEGDDNPSMILFESILDAQLEASKIISNNDEGYESYEIFELGGGVFYI